MCLPRSSTTLIALLLAAILATAACQEDDTVITVHKIDFKGVTAVPEARLRDALATHESSKLPWGRKRFFDRSQFDADLRRIVAFYADRGYPDARVTGFDVKPNARQNAVDVELTIDEGQPVLLTAVRFVGFDVVPPDHFETLQSRTPVKVGQPRDRQQVILAREMALNELRDHGFPYAKVEAEEHDGPDGKGAALSLVAEPGPLAHFGSVEVVGTETVGENVVRRQLAYQPGDLYQRSLLVETQRRMYRLDLFQFATVQALNLDQPEQPTDVPTRVTVAEGKHQRVNFGIGYGTDEKGRVEGEYRHVNFLGSARSAGVHARWSSLDRGIRLDFNQPYVFSSHLSLGGQGQQWYTYTPAYRSIVSGAKATLTHRSRTSTSLAASIVSEYDSSSISKEALSDPKLRDDLIALGLDPRTGEQNGQLNALAFDAQHSTADSVLDATRGYQLAFHAEQAGRIVPGTFNYWSVSADGRHYLPIGGRMVFASRLQLGSIDAKGDDEANVPFAKKYFLGGAASNRGWGRYEVSPLSGSGLPIGGDSVFAASLELRAALSRSFGGVIFLDAGNVWSPPWDIKLNDLRYAIGPGLRYQTPVGPLRFDIGYQINPVPGLIVNGVPQERRWRLHFSIGQAF